MELRNLKTFQLVATTLSFTQTAVLLNYAQSSVTAQIQALESELGTPLFDRLGRQIQLTPSGARLLQYTEQILSLSEEARATVAGREVAAGTLTVGAPETVCTYRLPSLLRRFRDRFPEVRLLFRPMLDVDLYQGIRSGELDLAFLLQAPVQASGLVAVPLVQEPLHVIASVDHPLAQRPSITPADLNGETILLTEPGCGYRHHFEQALARQGLYTVIKLDFSSVEAIKQCVMAGLGIGFLPRVAVAAEMEAGELYVLDWERQFTVYTQIIHHKKKWLSPAMKAFLDLTWQTLSEPQSN